jgi:hypothetical protein
MNIIFIILLAGYGIYNIIIADIEIAVFEIVVSVFLIITTYLFIKKIKILISIAASMAFFYIMSVYLFITGGASGTGIFWLFVIPVVYFFFLGSRYGTTL